MAKDPNFDLPLLCKEGKSSFFFWIANVHRQPIALHRYQGSTSIDSPLPCIAIKANFFTSKGKYMH
jgi:hypothetical protein